MLHKSKEQTDTVEYYFHDNIFREFLPHETEQRAYSFCGTIEYMAPEVVRGGNHGHDIVSICNEFLDYIKALCAILRDCFLGEFNLSFTSFQVSRPLHWPGR